MTKRKKAAQPPKETFTREEIQQAFTAAREILLDTVQPIDAQTDHPVRLTKKIEWVQICNRQIKLLNGIAEHLQLGVELESITHLPIHLE